MKKKAQKRGLFPEIAPRGGVLPQRSGSLDCKEVYIGRQSIHADNEAMVLVLKMVGGERAIGKACEMIDGEGYFRCVLKPAQQIRLMKMLVGLRASRELANVDRLVKPISEWG
jgi:hypothetical protein